MTDRQLEILRHALGVGPNGRGPSFRNHFVTGPGSDDYDDCCALACAGYMTRYDGNMMTGGDDFFRATAAGQHIATKGVRDESEDLHN